MTNELKTNKAKKKKSIIKMYFISRENETKISFFFLEQLQLHD